MEACLFQGYYAQIKNEFFDKDKDKTPQNIKYRT